jgi:hypothetical protein
MGDQKYLDSWPYMFDGVYICHSAGAGLAPWNALKYPLVKKDKCITVNNDPLIFYHFHDLQYLSNNSWYLGGYEIPSDVLDEIYKPYLKILLETNEHIKKHYNEIDSLNTTDIKNFADRKLKFKVGTYILGLKKSFKLFISSVFFINKRKYYKNNYVHIK